jgi:hypothetical protein
MFRINEDIRFKVNFLLAFILYSWNILKVNLCFHMHIYLNRFLFFYSLSFIKGEEDESDSMAKV